MIYSEIKLKDYETRKYTIVVFKSHRYITQSIDKLLFVTDQYNQKMLLREYFFVVYVIYLNAHSFYYCP